MALIVIDVETRSSGMPWSSRRMSSTESIATPVLPDLALGARMVGVEAHLRRQVERHAEPGLALIEQEPEARVRLVGRGHAGVLAHRPQPTPVHGRIRPSGEGVGAGAPQVAFGIESVRLQIGGLVPRSHLDAGVGAALVGAVGFAHRPQRTGRCPWVGVEKPSVDFEQDAGLGELALGGFERIGIGRAHVVDVHPIRERRQRLGPFALEDLHVPVDVGP